MSEELCIRGEISQYKRLNTNTFQYITGNSSIHWTYNLHQLKLQFLGVETVQFILSIGQAGNECRHSE